MFKIVGLIAAAVFIATGVAEGAESGSICDKGPWRSGTSLEQPQPLQRLQPGQVSSGSYSVFE